MYALPRSNYLRRGLLVNDERQAQIMKANPVSHSERIKNELTALGVTKYGLLKMESRYLPHIIHKDEHIGGVVYGRNEEGSVMLVATDRRVIYLDKKPMFVNEDELTYDVVSGVNFSRAGVGSVVILHTKVKNYSMRTLNQTCAEGFVEYIESRCLEHNQD